MPKRELSHPHQIDQWLTEWGERIPVPSEMTLIGSGGILWHAFEKGKDDPLQEKSMDVDPITFDHAVAELAYESIIGSEFEQEHGWHVNLMPEMALRGLPEGWQERSRSKVYRNLTVTVPAVSDLLVPKLQRNEPRDRSHEEYARSLGLMDS